MGGTVLQPYVHDCSVDLRIGRRSYGFQVFFKNHKYLELNQAIFRASYELHRGDLLIMKVDPTTGRYLPMRSGDITRFKLILNQ